MLPDGESGFNDLLRAYKKSARDKGHEFLLTEHQFRTLTKMECHYCGDPPRRARLVKAREQSAYIHNGIDRMENTKGYATDNCVPCCWTCNRFKGDKDHDEFLALTSKIHRYRGSFS